MWIDAHHHLWDPAVRPPTWMDPQWPIYRRFGTADLRAAIDGTPVQATVVVQTEPSLDETAALLETASADSMIVGVVGWLDLRADVGRQLDQIGGGELLVGVRHQAESEPNSGWLGADAVVSSVRALGRRGLAYDLLVRADQLGAAIALARDTRDTTRLVLDHCAKPPVGADLDDWKRSIRALAGFDHVACKLSGLVTEADWETWSQADLVPVADHVFECFGADRVMFGSDWPVCLLAASYAEVAEAAAAMCADLSHGERGQVFGGTARRWYRVG